MLLDNPSTLLAIKSALAHFGINVTFDLDPNLALDMHDGNGTNDCPHADDDSG